MATTEPQTVESVLAEFGTLKPHAEVNNHIHYRLSKNEQRTDFYFMGVSVFSVYEQTMKKLSDAQLMSEFCNALRFAIKQQRIRRLHEILTLHTPCEVYVGGEHVGTGRVTKWEFDHRVGQERFWTEPEPKAEPRPPAAERMRRLRAIARGGKL